MDGPARIEAGGRQPRADFTLGACTRLADRGVWKQHGLVLPIMPY
jgi:hypothetical protein